MLMSAGSPEPIPKTQEEYNLQVDAAIRDLFPRVPNTDRQMIIEHAFQRVCALQLCSLMALIDVFRDPIIKARSQ